MVVVMLLLLVEMDVTLVAGEQDIMAVSYTQLTLPTLCSV